MKPVKSIITLAIALSVTFAASAQQQQSTQKQQAPAAAAPAADKETQAKQGAPQGSPKQQWTNQYNAWKPQIEKYNQRAKDNGDKYAEFNKEAKNLNDLANAYNQRIARYDNASPEQKAKYSDEMSAEAKKVNMQAKKVQEMYDKNWPAPQKEAPKK